MTQKAKPASHSQYGFTLWHGMNLSGLVRLMRRRPLLHLARLHRIAFLPFTGIYNSVLGLIESAIYGSRVRQTEIHDDPLFVLGYWRSGTTLLHSLLCHDPNYQHLTTYRMLFPWHFLLTEKLFTKIPPLFSARPMDNIKVSWNSPQEEDMSLCVMGQISPMLITSHPHDLSYFWKSLDFSRLTPQELHDWKESLLLLMKKMTFADPRPIISKSPSHMYRIPLLLEMFPNARFVYIHRNPYHVFRSTMHLRRRGIEVNSLGRSDFESQGHEEDTINSYRFGFEAYERDRHLIPSGRLHEVAYEDLERSPIDEVRTIYEKLQLPGFDAVERSVQDELSSLRSYKKNQFDDDPLWVQRVYDELQPVYERFGYPAPELSKKIPARVA
ncbi:MAG TPA: sulfotransferase [Planctomycetaceae bacterium]|nr:sulfotransferase [Planctomycetaceae bacterium]